MEVFVFLTMFAMLKCENIRDYFSILENQLINSRMKSPPIGSNISVVDVDLSFLPAAILDMDSAKQVLTLTGSFYFEWKDPDLSWKPANYNGINSMRVEKNKIWIPGTLLLNGVKHFMLEDWIVTSVIYCNGTVIASTFANYQVTCEMDIFEFPFDTHDCKITIAPLDFNTVLHLSISNHDLSTVATRSSEWDIISSDTINGTLQSVIYVLSLKRQSSFYVTNIILPMALTSVMNAFVFLMPPQSGEKISFLVSIFVSHAVFLNFVNEVMPRGSSRTPKMTIYVVCIMCQSLAAILISSLTLMSYYRRDDDRDPNSTKGPKYWKIADVLCFVILFVISICNTLFLVM